MKYSVLLALIIGIISAIGGYIKYSIGGIALGIVGAVVGCIIGLVIDKHA